MGQDDRGRSGDSEALADIVRHARQEAGISQLELARRLGKSQTFVSLAENGLAKVGQRYVDAVLVACGLASDWAGPVAEEVVIPDVGWEIPKDQRAGTDPETFEPVRRGSARDLELRERFKWWTGEPHPSDYWLWSR